MELTPRGGAQWCWQGHNCKWAEKCRFRHDGTTQDQERVARQWEKLEEKRAKGQFTETHHACATLVTTDTSGKWRVLVHDVERAWNSRTQWIRGQHSTRPVTAEERDAEREKVRILLGSKIDADASEVFLSDAVYIGEHRQEYPFRMGTGRGTNHLYVWMLDPQYKEVFKPNLEAGFKWVDLNEYCRDDFNGLTAMKICTWLRSAGFTIP